MQSALSNKTIEKLKYDLVREKFITYDDLIKAEDIAKENDINLSQVLIKYNFLEEQMLLDFIEAKLHIPCVNLEDYTLDKTSLSLISEKEAKAYRIIPLFKIEDVLTIAMADPLDLFLLNKLISTTNCKIEPIICSERSILNAINKYYQNNDLSITDFHSTSSIEFDWREELNDEYPDDFQIKRIIQAIFYQASIEKIKEIVVENTTNGLSILFKKDNKFVESGKIPILLTPMFISKLKNISNLDSTIYEIPQLGKYKFFVDSYEIVASVATFPTIKGEKITIKFYTPPKDLNNLINNIDDLNKIESSINNSGIVVVAGPALSGKTSIIYSILSEFKRQKNIISIESVVKYDLPEITQCELNEKVGFSCEKAIQHVEFQSPDVIYVEELFTSQSIDYAVSLAYSGKVIITEFVADSRENLYSRLESDMFKEFKKMINCLIFIEEKEIKLLDYNLKK